MFNHPHERLQITMIMKYRDMCQVSLSEGRKELRFKIDHILDKFPNVCPFRVAFRTCLPPCALPMDISSHAASHDTR